MNLLFHFIFFNNNDSIVHGAPFRSSRGDCDLLNLRYRQTGDEGSSRFICKLRTLLWNPPKLRTQKHRRHRRQVYSKSTLFYVFFSSYYSWGVLGLLWKIEGICDSMAGWIWLWDFHLIQLVDLWKFINFCA